MIDKFKEKIFFPESDKQYEENYCDELEYVNTFAQKYLPSIDIDDETGKVYNLPSTAVETFIFRYNNFKKYRSGIVDIDENRDRNKLERSVSLDKYCDKLSKVLIKSLKLDPKKLWYLLLFIYDITHEACTDRMQTKKSPIEELNQFSDLIFSNIESINPFKMPKIEEEMKITLTIGKKKMIIENAQAIMLMAYSSSILSEQNSNNPFYNGRDIIDGANFPDTKKTYYFIKLMIAFFDTQEQIVSSRKKGAKVSHIERDLIIDFLKLNNYIKKDDLVGNIFHYKVVLSRYKDIELNDILKFTGYSF